MLSRDYIMRLLRDFTEALEKLLEERNKMEGPEFEIALQSMYNAYFNNSPQFYYTQDAEYIINELRQEYEGIEFLTRIDMLSELIFQDALCKQYEEQKYLLSKSLYLIEYLDKNSDTFSFERRARIEEIKNKLSF